MRTLTGIGLVFLFASALWGQSRGHVGRSHGNAGRGHGGFGVVGVPHSTYGSSHGFGNVVFPGTGRVPVGNPLSISDPTFAQRLGATVSGWPPYTGVGAPVFGKHRGVAAFPMVWPAFVGSGYPYQQPNVIVIQQPPMAQQQPAPQVIIQNFGTQPEQERDTVSVYRAPSRQPVERAAADPPYYLIAFKDSTIYSAVAYWVEGDTLHYITSGNVRNQVSLDLVDRELTARLNNDRGVQMSLQ